MKTLNTYNQKNKNPIDLKILINFRVRLTNTYRDKELVRILSFNKTKLIKSLTKTKSGSARSATYGLESFD